MNLTQLSEKFRRGVKIFLLIAAAYYTIVFGIFPSTRDFVKRLFVKDPAPDTRFGKLPPLQFIEKPLQESPTEVVYELNTHNGRLPADLPGRMYVYRMTDPQFSYLGGENAKNNAEVLGFTDDNLTTDLKGDVYTWKNEDTGSELVINSTTRILNMDTNLVFNKSAFREGELTEDLAVRYAKEMLNRITRWDDKYNTGRQTVRFGSFLGNKLLEAQRVEDAQLAMVDFYRNAGSFKILGPDPKVGLIHMIIRKPEKFSTLNYPVVDAYYWDFDMENRGAYPLIEVSTAWDAVKSGNGVIVNVTPKDANPFQEYKPVKVEKMLINNIYVAYYETNQFQKYLQPIFVFDGSYVTRGTAGGEFTIYYPAIAGEFIQ